MPLLIKPTLACNQGCTYCYENAFRKRHPQKVEYDIDKIVSAIRAADPKVGITLHGGEPLLLRKADVETIFKEIVSKIGRSGIQTNGTLIDDDYIEMFKKYKTCVGISLDGPGELNEYRLSVAKTDKLLNLIYRMRAYGIRVSLISVVSKSNAGTDERLAKYMGFVADMTKVGITGRLNPCVDSKGCQLDEPRMLEVYSKLSDFLMDNGYNCWSPFRDIWNSVLGKGNVVCTFRPCDIFHTRSAKIVLGDGAVTNCMRVTEKGLYERDRREVLTREDVLPQIPFEHGGCKDCEYWNYCHGGCPTQAIDGDWRNRTEICSMYRLLFRKYLGVSKFTGVAPAKTEGVKHREHGDVAHGDVAHGDHTDHGDSG